MTVTDTEWPFDEIGLGPSDSDLEHERARTDPLWRGAAAEWLASCQAYNHFAEHRLYAKQYSKCVEAALITTELLRRGYDEYAASLIDAIHELDEMRADDALKIALAERALAELSDPFRRAEFACLVWRIEEGYWPRRIELQDFMRSRFGIRRAEQILLRAINDPSDERCGLYFADDDWFAEQMNFPQPPNASPDTRCFVSAEAQNRHRLHEIYQRWAYTSITEEVAS